MVKCMFTIASRDLKYANKPLDPSRKTVTEWMKFVVENQCTLPEIESGKAFEVMKNQIVGIFVVYIMVISMM